MKKEDSRNQALIDRGQIVPAFVRLWNKPNWSFKWFRLILFMAFFEQAITVLQTLVIALGAGLGIWGVINLLEGYGNDNPGAKSQGMKQFMAN